MLSYIIFVAFYIKHFSKNNFIDKTLPVVHNKTEVVPKHYLSYLHDKPASITTNQRGKKGRNITDLTATKPSLFIQGFT